MTWRFIDSGPAPGARHMAIDEALLEAVARDRSPPLLRVFAFRPVCLSLGRFQACLPAGKASNRHLDPAALDGIDIVRRPSGGRAVLHAGDLCYSLIAPIDDPRVGGSPGWAGIRQSYRRIAAALVRALALLGAQSDVEVGATFRSPYPRTVSCFARAGTFELSLDGAKVVGSAQVRRNGALLQQGSLRLAADPELESRLLGHSQPALSQLLGRTIEYQEAAAVLRHAFAQALSITFRDSSLTREEESPAERLEREKYASPTWTWER